MINIHQCWVARNRSFNNSINQTTAFFWVSSLKVWKEAKENSLIRMSLKLVAIPKLCDFKYSSVESSFDGKALIRWGHPEVVEVLYFIPSKWWRSCEGASENCHDLPFANISEEYRDAVRSFGSKSLSSPQKVEILAQNQRDYGSLTVVFSRIAACAPHSADVEKVISLYNQLKTSHRSCLSNETIAHYLYVNLIMPSST